MKKIIILSILTLLVISLTVGLYIWFKPKPDAAKLKADVSVSAKKIIEDFKTDANSADKIYQNKLIQVTGTVKSLEKVNGIDIANLDLEDVTIQCQMAKKDIVQQGMIISLKGFYIGYDDLDGLSIQLKDCVIAKE